MSVQQYSPTVVREPLVPEITLKSVLAVAFTVLMVTSVFAMTVSPAMFSSSGASERVEAAAQKVAGVS